ncbi:hypothetical protein KM043_017891 [Ampulex compressa]|nr:hypothetical protein KM043_017891 [Ampulex compressa]
MAKPEAALRIDRIRAASHHRRPPLRHPQSNRIMLMGRDARTTLFHGPIPDAWRGCVAPVLLFNGLMDRRYLEVAVIRNGIGVTGDWEVERKGISAFRVGGILRKDRRIDEGFSKVGDSGTSS